MTLNSCGDDLETHRATDDVEVVDSCGVDDLETHLRVIWPWPVVEFDDDETNLPAYDLQHLLVLMIFIMNYPTDDIDQSLNLLTLRLT